MKTSSILLLAGFILLPWCLAPLFSQNQNEQVEKRIIITKHSTGADGSEMIETTIKEGKAALNFDVDKFVRETRDDNTQVEVRVKDYYECPPFVCFYPGSFSQEDLPDDRAFLGVEPDSDEDAGQPGVAVQIIRGTAAETAGLHDNDKILKINEISTNRWEDLADAINKAKPGDKVSISYERNGQQASTEATLITRKDIQHSDKTLKGFLGVSESDEDMENDNAGVRVSMVEGSAAEKAGLKDGDVITRLNDTPVADFEDISDFMAYTKPGDKVTVGFTRAGAAMTQEVVLGESAAQQETREFQIGMPRIHMDMKQLRESLRDMERDITIHSENVIKQKEACLGVYSRDDEEGGAVVSDFSEESAAQDAGMLKGDEIQSVNGHKVNGNSALWDEIARYKTGEQVEVAYERDDKPMQVKVTLRACRDHAKNSTLFKSPDSSPWFNFQRKHLQETRIIVIRKPADSSRTATTPPATDHSLQLENFRVFPNPTQGPATIEFEGAAVPTVVSLFDVSGRQLFREELNAFDGAYSRQFDLSAYAKGAIIVHIQQGKQVYTEQVVVD